MQRKENTSFLTIKNLHYSTNEKVLFSNLNIDIQPKQIIGLVGQNGTGKSTLLKIICGLNQGKQQLLNHILWNDIPLSNIHYTERIKLISYLPQKTNLYYNLSVKETILLGRSPFRTFLGTWKKIDYELLEKVLIQVNLENMKHRSLFSLSGGELQRVMLARLLITQAPFMLIDEPTASLDISHTLHFFNILKELVTHQNISIIVSIHDLNLANKYCDSIICLSPQIKNGYIFGKTSKILSVKNINQYFNVKTTQNQGFSFHI